VLVRVPQHLEVPSLSSTVAGVAVPLAAARVEPGQRAQMFLPSRSLARACCERALPDVDQLREDAHAADGRGEGEQRGRWVVLRVFVALRTRWRDRHEPGHGITCEHRERARAQEVPTALLQRGARVVAEGPAREPEAGERGIGEELGDGAERVARQRPEQRRERRLEFIVVVVIVVLVLLLLLLL
jgi:hypothetical protein